MTSQTTTPADVAAVEEFAFRCVGDFSGAMSVLLAALGDRLGLFRALEDGGPATPAELARRAGAHERYVHEWLRGMVAAGYLTLDRASGRFALPPAHAPALAHEAGPYFMPGAFSMIQGLMTPYEHLVEAFRRGGGVEQREYGASVWDGMQRFTASWFENLLLGQWMPHLPDVDERLRRGARLADVGCGSGRAVITLARAYPASTFVGYDVFEGQIDRARRAAAEAGVADRVRFEQVDAARGLPERYDVVTTFDVVHDAADPRAVLRAIRAALADDGRYLMLEINCQDDPDDNVGPLAAMFYGFSVFYCMTTSLAHGGEGLGTHGLPEARVRELCAEAGFSSVRRLPIDNPLNILYEIAA